MKPKFINNICFLLFFVAVCNGIIAQKTVQSKVEKILESKVFKHANLSMTAIDIEEDTVLVNYLSEKVLIPASSLKVITTLCAIEELGDNYSFETKITHDGKIAEDGTLKGNIYIEGSGDPTLGSIRIDGVLDFKTLLQFISQEIIDYGITCIDGKIIADESIFESYPVSPSWQWNDLGNYYASGAWGINVHENLYYLYFHKRSKVGSRPEIKFFEPHIPKIEFSNELLVDSAGTGDNAYIFGGPYTYKKRIAGTIPAGKGTFSIKGSIPDPPSFLAEHLTKKLKKENIHALGFDTQFTKDKYKKRRSTISSIQSPSLDKIVEKANEKSINLYCESLLKTIAKHNDRRGSGGDGIVVIERILKKQGVDIGGLHMEDGSGLSARNQASSKTLAETIGNFTKSFGTSRMHKYLASTSEGTVVGMFSGTPLAGRVWLKSGSMERVYSYTGLLQNKEGKWIAFSVIVNGFQVKHKVMKPYLVKLIRQLY